MRLHMCQVYVCTAQDVVLCVGQASLRVSCCVVLWPGHCGGLTRKVSCLPSLRGGPHAVAAPATLTDLLGARAERVPDCSSYLSRIPGSATDSGSSIHPRNSVDRPAVSPSQPPRGRLHALLNANAAGESTAAGSLKAASLNAGAASESTTAGGLEAFTRGSAGFENASSKFRWNPSPLLPLMRAGK